MAADGGVDGVVDRPGAHQRLGGAEQILHLEQVTVAERLAASVARYAGRAVVLSQLAAGNPDQLACRRRPVCSEMWPGNTADVSVLLPVIDRLRSRFAIGRVCVVADRGMISAATITALEERGLEYVLGARERTDTLVRRVVLADSRPFTPLCIPRAGGAETRLFVKEVTAEGRRYVVCRNEAEAAKAQGVESAADQRRDVGAGLRYGTAHLPAALGRRPTPRPWL